MAISLVDPSIKINLTKKQEQERNDLRHIACSSATTASVNFTANNVNFRKRDHLGSQRNQVNDSKC